MLGIKSFFGIVLLVVALYFLKNSFPALRSLARPDTTFMAVAFAVAAVGLVMGAVHLSWDDGGLVIKARKVVGVVLSVAGLALFWTSCELPKGSLTWEHSEEVASAKAKSEKRPMLIDFTAEWCGACKELAKETFSDPRVKERAVAANFVAVKVDATDDENPQVNAVKDKYKVVGLPTVVLYDSNGTERKRFNEFVGPEPFLRALESVQ
jgi:thiol:disulfide interchange protein DsbD